MNVKLAKANNLLLVCILALLPIMVHGITAGFIGCLITERHEVR